MAMRAKRDENARRRSFGFVVGGGFTVIGVWPVVFHAAGPRLWALAAAVPLLVLAVVWPSALKPVQRIWMKVGEALGWVNSRILLSLVYYLVIVPIGLVRRIAGSDPMRRQFDPNATTYKVARSTRAPSHMFHQY